MSLQQSPFKFLDAYQQEDDSIFFGRERETEDLYEALSGVKQLLVYGPSGAGKTSLVECGLRNQFSDADWFALTIRRGSNTVASVYQSINEALEEPILLDEVTQLPTDKSISFGQAIENLFSERYQPIYLLFDQFEELLLHGGEEEKRDFFIRLHDLIRYKVPCRVLLIMREEFIGHLSEYESLCPSLFQHRFRLEKMGRPGVRKVISQTLAAPEFQPYFSVGNSEILADAVLDRLPDHQQEIELTHVQVFLSELWDRARAAAPSGEIPHLHPGLIQKEDNLETVLDSFLKKQLRDLAPVYGKTAPLEVLAVMISKQHTKLQLSQAEITLDLSKKEIELPNLLSLLEDLEQRRLVRALKTGGLPRFEISHDVLARIVGRNLTEEMQLREKAREIYRVYGEREGLLSQQDLDYLRPFQQYLALPPALKKQMEDSEQALAKEKEAKLAAARRRLRVVVGLLVLAIFGLLAARYYYLDADKQKRAAKDAEKLALDQKATADAEKERADSLREEAVLALETIKQQEAELRQEVQKRRVVERDNIIKDSLNDIEKYKRFMTQARGLEQQKSYEAAIISYESAIEFAQDSKIVSQAIADCRKAQDQEREYNELLATALEEEAAKDYDQAIKLYEQAVELVGDRPDLREQAINCENILKDATRKAKENADVLSYDPELAEKYRLESQEYNSLVNRLQELLHKPLQK